MNQWQFRALCFLLLAGLVGCVYWYWSANEQGVGSVSVDPSTSTRPDRSLQAMEGASPIRSEIAAPGVAHQRLREQVVVDGCTGLRIPPEKVYHTNVLARRVPVHEALSSQSTAHTATIWERWCGLSRPNFETDVLVWRPLLPDSLELASGGRQGTLLTADGYCGRIIETGNGEVLDDPLKLWPETSGRITIVDELNNPVPDVHIVLYCEKQKRALLGESSCVQVWLTGEDGSVTARVPKGEPFVILAVGPYIAPPVSGVVECDVDETSSWTVPVSRMGRVTGRVVDQHGTAVPGCRVSLTSARSALARSSEIGVISGPGGLFEFSSVPLGRVLVFAYFGLLSSIRGDPVIGECGPGAYDVGDVVAPRTEICSVKLVGIPNAKWLPLLGRLAGEGWESSTVPFDLNGYAEISGVEGDVGISVRVGLKDGAGKWEEIASMPVEKLPCNVELDIGHIVGAITVTDSRDRPVTSLGWRAVLGTWGELHFLPFGVRAKLGQVWAGLPAGTYNISLSLAESIGNPSWANVNVEAGHITSLAAVNTGPGSIRVSLEGSAVDWRNVRIVAANRVLGKKRGRGYSVVEGQSVGGHQAVVARVPAGIYTVVAYDGLRVGSCDDVVVSGGLESRCSVGLAPIGGIRGLVHRAGEPVIGASVSISSLSRDLDVKVMLEKVGSLSTDENGAFPAVRLPAGAYEVSAGGVTTWVNVHESVERVILELGYQVREFHIAIGRNAPWVWDSISATSIDASSPDFRCTHICRLTSDGRLEFWGGKGKYLVEAWTYASGTGAFYGILAENAAGTVLVGSTLTPELDDVEVAEVVGVDELDLDAFHLPVAIIRTPPGYFGAPAGFRVRVTDGYGDTWTLEVD